ncbi:hypothetical protein NQZ68_023229 [Dissostichus eleginoides]|nr:hypothetical protein NQZ68_023229 [Dissostichus eleginoides]
MCSVRRVQGREECLSHAPLRRGVQSESGDGFKAPSESQPNGKPETTELTESQIASPKKNISKCLCPPFPRAADLRETKNKKKEKKRRRWE